MSYKVTFVDVDIGSLNVTPSLDRFLDVKSEVMGSIQPVMETAGSHYHRLEVQKCPLKEMSCVGF